MPNPRFSDIYQVVPSESFITYENQQASTSGIFEIQFKDLPFLFEAIQSTWLSTF